MFYIAIAAVASGGMAALQVHAFAQLLALASLQSNGSSDASRWVISISLFVGCEIAGSVSWRFLAVRQEVGALRLSLSTSITLLDHAQAVHPQEFEDPEFLDALERVQQGLGSRPAQLIRGMTDAAVGVGAGLGALAAIWKVGPVLALAISLVLSVPVAGALLASPFESRIFNANLEDARRVGYLTGVGLHRRAIAENRLFGFDRLLRREAKEIQGQVVKKHADLTSRALLIEIAAYLVMGILAVGVLLWASELEGFVVLLFSYQRLETAFAMAGQGMAEVGKSVPFLRGAGEVLRASPVTPLEAVHEGTTEPSRVPSSTSVDCSVGQIELGGVSFGYQGQSAPALDGISCVFEKGSVYALVGRNGSGKSTLMALLAGLLEPSEGAILADGRPIDARGLWSAASLQPQRMFMYELQAGVVATGFGDLRDDSQLWSAAFGVDEIFAELPRGKNNLLGRSFEGAQDLSLGQWQRLVLARAFSSASSVLLLDEPTSFLDQRYVDRLAEAIDMANDRIVVLSTHDVQLFGLADWVIELESGRIKRAGPGTGSSWRPLETKERARE